MALPLGELSPKVTERVLQTLLNGDINLCAHAAKIHINISVGKTQDLQSKRCQKCGTAGRFPVDCCPLVWSCFPSQSAAPTALPKGEPSSARNALHRTVYRSAPLLSVRQARICQPNCFLISAFTLSKSLQVKIGISRLISSMLLSHHLNLSSNSISSSSKRF